jgi:hypothetical protein
MVTDIQHGDAAADIDDDARPFMTSDVWYLACAMPFYCRKIGMAQARCVDLDKDLAFPRSIEMHFFDFEGLALSKWCW